MSIVTTKQAIDLLNSGEIVALPTETVYGLAGTIDKASAIEKIFVTKSRPHFDPLIVHVASAEQACELTTAWSKAHQVLSDCFWPGPLTLVSEKTSAVSDLITAGMKTVALRNPNHPLTLEILRNLNAPVAAPSANRFGHTSPTTAQHVLNEFNHQVSVVDGGPCSIGVESTICALAIDENGLTMANILRRGMIASEQIQHTLSKAGIQCQVNYPKNAEGPGSLKDHYQPDIPLILANDSHSNADFLKRIREILSLGEDDQGVELVLNSSPQITARLLYAQMRSLSASGAKFMFCRWPKSNISEPWETILDRLKKASSYEL